MSSRHSRAHRAPILALSFVVIALTAPFPLLHAQGQQDRVDVLIAFASTPGPDDEALVRGAGGRVKYRYTIAPGIAANIPQQAVAALRGNPRITAIEPDLRVTAIDIELDNSWGVKRIGSGSVHADGIRGAAVRVAVIDTGIDYTHPDLAANYGGGIDYANDDLDPFDDNNHGTHVAGTVAAVDDDAGVVGVAPDVTLLAVKALDQEGSGYLSDIMAGVQWAADNGAHVTNNSYGIAQYPGSLFQAAFDNSAARGVLHIAAAGNSGTCAGTTDSVNYPARYASVVAVAATNQSDLRACFSSTGPAVELSAPGVEVRSTMPGGGHGIGSGTSMASPHAAGAAALVLSAGVTDDNADGRVNDDVRRILTTTAQDLGAGGRDTWFGFGIVDVAAAVAAVVSPPTPDPAVSVAVSTDRSSYTQGLETTAQVTVVLRDEAGAAISGVPEWAFATSLDGNAVAVVFAETSTAGTYAGALDISGAASGSHTVAIMATDSRGISGAGSAPFSVTPLNTVRVQSIDYSGYGGANANRHVLISVLVVGGSGAPVAGATVSVLVTRNGVFYGATNGMSGSDGRALFEAKNAPSGCYETTVAAVIAGTRVWDEATPPNRYCK